jgi:protein involved in polysaccharide export with SLBB domain
MTPHANSFATVKGKKRIAYAMTLFSGVLHPAITLRNRGAHMRRVCCLRVGLSLATMVISVASAAAQSSDTSAPLTQSSAASTPYDLDRGATTENRDTSMQDRDNATPARPVDSTRPSPYSNVDIPGSLTTSQIRNVLEQQPEAIVELKSMLAAEMQQQGSQIQADDITDKMLYDQIVSSSALREQITTFLLARGYISDDDLQQLAPNIHAPNAAATAASVPMASEQIDSREFARSLSTLPDSETGIMPTGVMPVPLNTRPTAPSLEDETASAPRNESAKEKQREQDTQASTDEPKVLRQPAPYNLQSLRDLYTQLPQDDRPLKRFGSELFTRDTSTSTRTRDNAVMSRGESGRDTPLDVPLGPDYIVGPGDTLTITLWGGLTQTFTRVIDRDGRILLPDAGSLDVAGLALSRVQALVEGALQPQFRNAQIAVTVSQLRSVRVYVVGDVLRPGGFDISALATPLSALYAAGGPTAAGSLRILRHYRGQSLVDEIDLYDFLLHGLRGKSAGFESGDTLLVPPVGPQVAISGAIKRPAIYELKPGETSLAAIVENAGGFTAAVSPDHIAIERIAAGHQRETVSVDLSAAHDPAAIHTLLAGFSAQDGDRVRIASIPPYSERLIYLEGHVVRPGRQPFRDGLRLSDVLRNDQDMLPEPASHGEIVRLVPPDLHAETIAFDIPDVLVGNTNVDLHPFDTIRIFGRYQVDAPRVTIHGEVLRPGSYPLSKDMTAAQLVRMAGGFKSDALVDIADLTSYTINAGNKVVGNLTAIHIGAAVAGTDPAADIALKRGDILTIHQITGWNDIGESVTIQGQVAYPGSYGFREGERLSSVLRRAGGFRETAYPAGAVLVRESVRELEQKSREELIRQIETGSAAARLAPNLGGDSAANLQLIQAQQDQVLSHLKSDPPSGRLVVHLSADIDSWSNTDADIELRRGDILTIPKRPGFVLVTGQVYNITALTFAPGKTAAWYLSHAGGTNTTANRKEIFIIRANGSVLGRNSGGWFDSNVLSTKLDPGDVVVVPQKIMGGSLFWKNLLTAAQLASSIAITAVVANL